MNVFITLIIHGKYPNCDHASVHACMQGFMYIHQLQSYQCSCTKRSMHSAPWTAQSAHLSSGEIYNAKLHMHAPWPACASSLHLQASRPIAAFASKQAHSHALSRPLQHPTAREKHSPTGAMACLLAHANKRARSAMRSIPTWPAQHAARMHGVWSCRHARFAWLTGTAHKAHKAHRTRTSTHWCAQRVP